MKSYNIKIYSKTGIYITTVKQTTRLSKIGFRSTVNGGQGSLSLAVTSPFDDPPSWAVFMNFVKVFVVKICDGVQTEELFFTGYISRISHVKKGSNEYMTLDVLSLSSLLGLALYKDGASFDVVHTSVDPATIATDIIDAVNTGTNDWLSYGTNVESVGVNVSYTFEKQRWLKALTKTLEFAGGDFFWFIGADGDLNFKSYPTTPTHKFNILKDVNEISIDNTSEGILNSATLDNGTAYGSEDATSVSTYFQRDQWESDTGMDATTAQQYVDGIVVDEKDPKLSITVEVNTNYDIESIQPGHTCNVFGVKTGSTVLGSNMKIVAVEYSESRAVLTIAEDVGNYGEQLSKYFANQLQERQLS